MTINEAITAVLSASHHGDQHFRAFLKGDDPEVVAMRQALVQLADAVREVRETRQLSHDANAFDEVFDPSVINGFFIGWDNSDKPQLWVWRGEPDESAEPWQRIVF